MADEPAGVPAARDEVVLTGMGAASVFGRGAAPLLDGASTGVHGFDEVTRFDVRRRRVRSAAHMPGSPDLASELVAVIEDACEDAALSANDRARCLLLLAAHADRSLTERQGPVAGPPAESPGPVAGPLPGWPGPVAGPLPEWPGPVAEWPGAVAEWPGAVDGIQTAHNGGGLAASVASRCAPLHVTVASGRSARAGRGFCLATAWPRWCWSQGRRREAAERGRSRWSLAGGELATPTTYASPALMAPGWPARCDRRCAAPR